MSNIIAEAILANLNAIERFTVIDCGAYFGMQYAPWQILGHRLVMHGFDAFADECQRLNQQAQAAGVAHHYHPACLAESVSTGRPFYITRSVDSSSLLKPAENRIRRWRQSIKPPAQFSSMDTLGLARVATVNTTTLDAWAGQNGNPDVDFMKLDLQGGELGALRGGQQLLTHVLGLEVEVFFIPAYEGQPLFADIDVFLRQAGFSFFNFIFTHTGHFAGRAASPIGTQYPENPLFRAQGAGQLMSSDALYLFDPLDQPPNGSLRFSLPKLLKLVIVAEAYNQIEFAFEVLTWIRADAVNAQPALVPALDQILASAAARYRQ